MLDQNNTETINVSSPDAPDTEREPTVNIPDTEKVEVAATEKPKQDAPVPKSRFNEIYAKNKQLERQNAQMLEALTRGQASAQVNGQANATVDAPPDISKYTDQAEYIRDLAQHEGRQAATQQFQKLTEAQKVQSTQEAEQARFISAAQKFSKIPGLADALEATAHIVYPPEHQLLIMDSDVAKDLTLHLAANLDEAEHIASLSTAQAAREIGRIEGMIKASTVNGQAAKVSKMKAPISPVGAGNSNNSLEYTPGMNPVKFLEWEKSQRK